MTVTYDNAGRQVTLQDVSGVLTYAYDDAGQLTAATFPGPKTLTYTFDDAGKRATLVDPDGGVTTFAYDSAARLTSLLNPFAERTTWAYDAAGQVTTMTLGNATETTFTFDDAGQVTGIHAHTSGGSLIQSFAYAYSDAGVRTGVLEGAGDRVTWSYDANWRLTREQRSGSSAYDITYAYDPVGSRLTKLTGGATTTYTYNAGDALTLEEVAGALTTYGYDADGNTTVVNASGALTTMTWDHCMERRASGSVGSVLCAVSTAGGVVTSVYDATGLRRQREDASGVTKYLWDGVNLLAETNSGGTTQARYTAALGQYGPVLSQRRSGTSAFYHAGALGTINRLTDASQNVTDLYALDAWGRSVSSSGSTTNPHRYIGALGYYHETALGLDYVRARWLRPATGSWVSVDPVEGEARYGYVTSAPVQWVDPSGMDAIRVPVGEMGSCITVPNLWDIACNAADRVDDWIDRPHQGSCVEAPLVIAGRLLCNRRRGWPDHLVHCVAFCREQIRSGTLDVVWIVPLTEVAQALPIIPGTVDPRDETNNAIGVGCGARVTSGEFGSCEECCRATAIPAPPPGGSSRGTPGGSSGGTPGGGPRWPSP